ncbi:MAG: hypothetical protein ACU0CA_17580 [Paracoccaceae bacterium]
MLRQLTTSFKRLAGGLVVIAFATLPANAQDQSMSQAASDPTASITAYLFQDYYTSSHYNQSGTTANRLQFRAAIPFQLGGTKNIARLTIPYFTESARGISGIGDITLFNLTVFDQPWGRWGVGAVALLPTGSEGLSARKWGLGPAVGFTASSGDLLWGLFNQNLFTVAGDSGRPDVNVSNIQPILNYSLSNGWAVGASEMSAVYDWEQNRFVSIPLGVSVSKLSKFGDQLVQFVGSYERNFYTDGIAPKDTFSFTVKFLVPN